MKRSRRSKTVGRGKFSGLGRPRWTSAAAYQGERRKRHTRKPWTWFIPLWGGAAILGAAYGSGWPIRLVAAGDGKAVAEGAFVRTSFTFCHVGGGYNCVVDGDTIWFAGARIRIADIDAPETHDYRCAAEKELGDRATKRLHELLESGDVTLEPIDRDEDQYGRKLRRVFVDGKGVGDTLVKEGLARYFGTGRRSWC